MCCACNSACLHDGRVIAVYRFVEIGEFQPGARRHDGTADGEEEDEKKKKNEIKKTKIDVRRRVERIGRTSEMSNRFANAMRKQ